MRYLRTDDISGAQPKQRGFATNKSMIAGNPSGNKSSYKNDSQIFDHVYEQANINSHFSKLPLKSEDRALFKPMESPVKYGQVIKNELLPLKNPPSRGLHA